MLRRLRRRRERAEDRRAVEPAVTRPEIDPIGELVRIVGEQEPVSPRPAKLLTFPNLREADEADP